MSTYIGKSVLRGEDDRLLKGKGTFTDDIQPADGVFAAFVRSPHAHGRIVGIDVSAATNAPGVLRVLTATDWAAAGLGQLPCIAPVNCSDGKPMQVAPRPVFAGDKVCHVGDNVAAVIAETREKAMDAAELIDVDYEPLEAVAHPGRACDPGAPLVHDAFGTNLSNWIEVGDKAGTDSAFKHAHHITELVHWHNRVSANPIEPRAYVAHYDEAHDRYTLWATGQNPHLLQRMFAVSVLRVPTYKVRVVCPDVGGGFGVKYFGYPEQAVLLWSAKLTGRAVRWTATRSECLVTDTHGRDQFTAGALAFDEHGHILAIRCESTQSYGAYSSTFAPVILMHVMPETLVGMYKVPVGYVRINGVFTHTPPVDAYRGTKQAAAYLHERLMDRAAREMAIDPAELRLRNYLKHEDYPHTHVFAKTYDSANPSLQHETLATLVDYQRLREEQRAQPGDGERLGIGMAAVMESTGMGPSRQMSGPMGGWESAQIRVHPDGKVSLFVGTHSHGQSHEITFRQLAADQLGIALEDIEFSQGDTDMGPGNLGTAAGRALTTAGMGVVEGVRRIVEKGKTLAAHLMECAVADIEYQDGHFSIPGTDKRLSFSTIAEAAYAGSDYPEEGFELGLEETVFYDPAAWGYPTALNLAVVLVDEETGVVRIRDYYTVDDCGRVINPMIVHGQVHGGVAQGVGQVLMEQIAFDETGQVLTGSFIDYAMPRADDLPSFGVAFQETLNPNNALGAKGCSETGTVAAPPAISNAVVDALAPLGVKHIEMPLTAEKVWRAIVEARG